MFHVVGEYLHLYPSPFKLLGGRGEEDPAQDRARVLREEPWPFVRVLASVLGYKLFQKLPVALCSNFHDDNRA